MVWLVLLVLVILALGGGGWGYSRYGYVGFSPLVIVLLLIAALWAFGYLR